MLLHSTHATSIKKSAARTQEPSSSLRATVHHRWRFDVSGLSDLVQCEPRTRRAFLSTEDARPRWSARTRATRQPAWQRSWRAPRCGAGGCGGRAARKRASRRHAAKRSSVRRTAGDARAASTPQQRRTPGGQRAVRRARVERHHTQRRARLLRRPSSSLRGAAGAAAAAAALLLRRGSRRGRRGVLHGAQHTAWEGRARECGAPDWTSGRRPAAVRANPCRSDS